MRSIRLLALAVGLVGCTFSPIRCSGSLNPGCGFQQAGQSLEGPPPVVTAPEPIPPEPMAPPEPIPLEPVPPEPVPSEPVPPQSPPVPSSPRELGTTVIDQSAPEATASVAFSPEFVVGKGRGLCLQRIDGDATDDVVGLADHGRSLVARSGVDGSIVWQYAVQTGQASRCAGPNHVAVQHEDGTVTIVAPTTNVAVTTPRLTARLREAWAGADCFGLGTDAYTSATVAAADGAAVAQCTTAVLAPRAGSLYRPPVWMTLDDRAYALRPPVDALGDTVRLVAAKPYRGGLKQAKQSQAGAVLWEAPFPPEVDPKDHVRAFAGPGSLGMIVSASGRDADAWLLSFDRKTGVPRFTTRIETPSAEILGDDGQRIIVDDGSRVRAFDSTSGERVWFED